MIITFKSAAAGDVIMFGDVAKQMMAAMGKEPGEKGIVTVEQLPEAITRLRAAIAADKMRWQGVAEEDRPAEEKAPGGNPRAFVSLSQRGAPLLELLEWAEKGSKPVVWGV